MYFFQYFGALIPISGAHNFFVCKGLGLFQIKNLFLDYSEL